MNKTNLPGGELTGANVAADDALYIWDGSASGIARTKWIVMAQLRRALGEGFNAQVWSAGALTITPGAMVQRHLEAITVTLSSGAAALTVADGTAATRFAGNRMDLLFKLPGTAGIAITVSNSTGDVLAAVQDDGSGDDLLIELYHDGTKWRALRATYPTNV